MMRDRQTGLSDRCSVSVRVCVCAKCSSSTELTLNTHTRYIYQFGTREILKVEKLRDKKLENVSIEYMRSAL